MMMTTISTYFHCYIFQHVKTTILDILTPEDIKILMETEDEVYNPYFIVFHFPISYFHG